MNSLHAISLSGMNATRMALEVSAHRIANLSAPGNQSQGPMATTVVQGGVSGFSGEVQIEKGWLEGDFVGLLLVKNQFLANRAVFRTNDRMIGSLLDLTS
jgi:flagellar hook protein FlgE